MARKTDRIIALVIAVAFFATSFALSFFVIWELYRGNKEAKTVNQPANTANNSAKDAPKTMLQGTKLANFTPVAKIDSLQRQEVKAGTGTEVKPGDTVTVDYTGAVAATGVIFQSSLDRGQPISFSLNGVIAGWKDGIPGAKVGGTYRLLIPAAQAYAASPPEGSGIPADADLVFDITVHSASKANE
jgi:FKBP-type peptidyl-prolyl cis-trans isomerase